MTEADPPRARPIAPDEVRGEVQRARPVLADAAAGDVPRARPVAVAGAAAHLDDEEEGSGESRAYLLTLGFLVLGPTVIPRIRRSDAFSPAQKRFWSLMLTAYSVLMVCVLIVAVSLIVGIMAKRM